MKETITTYLPESLQAYDPLLVLGVGLGVLILLILLLVPVFRLTSGARVRHSGLAIQSFQIAPLGRDAFLKVTNTGPPVTFTSLIVTERADVSVKNQVAGQLLQEGDSYSILLEATADERLSTDFQLYFSFFDQERRNYQQQFSLDPVASVKLTRS